MSDSIRDFARAMSRNVIREYLSSLIPEEVNSVTLTRIDSSARQKMAKWQIAKRYINHVNQFNFSTIQR